MYNSNFDIWIAGAFAAVTVDLVVYPVDTLKTRIQAPDYDRLYKDARTGAVRRNVLFRGLYQGDVEEGRETAGTFFTTYEAVKYTLTNSSTHTHHPDHNRLPFTHSLPPPVIHAISSSTAEMIACLMLTPAEVLKQNAQVVDLHPGEGPQRQQARHAMVQVLSRFRRRPWKLWSGYTALVGRNLPFTGLQFPIFEFVRSRVVAARQRRKDARGEDVERWNPVLERAVLTGMSASVSGTIAAVVTTPIDVIKTRVMLSASLNGENGNAGGGDAQKKASRGTLAVGTEIFRNEGIRGLFKGGAIRAGWTAISLSMYLSMYEGGRFYLENRRREKHGLSPREEVGRSGDEAAI
ncbi:putative mitochondrial carrier protein [Aspergillus clavatus NRRL 1]|uniref:Mitochondrial carrier protein, putative n=1 Tax=Aspergillus clavatus (strain ATCC 1007 / CBS 513.65 / DSM 816 / NCTC 3887 / NRRL 1 / QM 1276 / 107) TaxID=344612 RepID=A1CQB3_ASPCL|nr:mitochondrial carrier protein, putative [Aspergillus clavatus NRRL 1]EAW07834.1 mitochondrial carrier protein, putative [Aspergillus clavatus NRRL 1]